MDASFGGDTFIGHHLRRPATLIWESLISARPLSYLLLLMRTEPLFLSTEASRRVGQESICEIYESLYKRRRLFELTVEKQAIAAFIWSPSPSFLRVVVRSLHFKYS